MTLEDIYEADLIIILGQNPGTNHPRMLGALERAKHNGAKIVAINPLPEAGLINFMNPQRPSRRPRPRARSSPTTSCRSGSTVTSPSCRRSVGCCSRWRTSAPGSVLDRAFVESYTHGFDAYAAHVRALSWPDVEAATGLPRDEIEQLAREIAGAKRVIACWAMGLTQHKNSVATIREVVNVLLLGGHIGRPGAGVCPVRGHSNVQGDRTMGIWEKPPDAFLDALRDEFGFEPPREHGLDTVDTIRAIRDGKVDVLLAVGGNFASATPDTGSDRGRAADAAAERPRVDQAQPIPRGDRRDRADPPDARPDRAGRPGRPGPSRVGRGLDGPGAPLPRSARAGRA